MQKREKDTEIKGNKIQHGGSTINSKQAKAHIRNKKSMRGRQN